MNNLVIFGSSGYAQSIVEIVEAYKDFNFVGFIDNAKAPGTKVLSSNVIGSDEELPELMQRYNISHGVIGVGDNYLRKKIARNTSKLCPRFKFLTCVHPGALVSQYSNIGLGSVLLAGAVVNAGARVGEHCIVNTNASVDHDSIVEDYVSLGPSVAVSGGCRIGSFSRIGVGACFFDGVEVGSHCLIGGGSVVTKNINSGSVCYGVPARFVRHNSYPLLD